MAISSEISAEARPSGWRRHTDPPALWPGVVVGSGLLHVLAVLLLWPWIVRLTVAESPTGSAEDLAIAPVELVEVTPSSDVFAAPAENPVAEAPAPDSTALNPAPEASPTAPGTFETRSPDPSIFAPAPTFPPEDSTARPLPRQTMPPFPTEQPTWPPRDTVPPASPEPRGEMPEPTEETAPQPRVTPPSPAETAPPESDIATGPSPFPSAPPAPPGPIGEPEGTLPSPDVPPDGSFDEDLPDEVATGPSPEFPGGVDESPDLASVDVSEEVEPSQIQADVQTELMPATAYIRDIPDTPAQTRQASQTIVLNPVLGACSFGGIEGSAPWQYMGQTVAMQVFVSEDGREVEVLDTLSSSGDAAYDEFAACLVENQLEFVPATMGGSSVASDSTVVRVTLSRG